MHLAGGSARRCPVAGTGSRRISAARPRHLVEDGTAVDFALYGKRHARRDIRFNQAGYDIDAWTLGRDNHMDTGARAFWARRAICCSTALRSVIIRSASSSITTTIIGSFSSGSGSSGFRLNGLGMGLPDALAASTFWLKPSKLRTPAWESRR